MKKKLNIAILTMLLMFQTVFSPISVFADEVIPPVAPLTTGAGAGLGGDDSTVASGDSAGVTVPEDNTEQEEPTMMPLGELAGYPASSMQSDISMSFSGLKLYTQDGTLITNATDLANYSGRKPQKGDTVYLNYVFPVNPNQDYGIGSTFTFQLPAHMIEEYTAGSFNKQSSFAENGYVDYSTNYNAGTKTVTVTLDGELEDAQSGTMKLEFMAKFGNFVDENELEQELTIPVLGGADVQLDFIFAPLGSGQLISKQEGAITRDANGTVTIPWTVWVNTGGKKLENAQLNDETDLKHELSGNITVDQYKIGLNGFNPNNPGTPVSTNNSATAFPINLSDGYYAYKVTYNTKVTADPTASSMDYKNIAILTGTDIPLDTKANGTQNVKYGPSLDKTQSGDKYHSTWTIKYNWLGQKIAADKANLTDVMSTSGISGKHKIDYTKFYVYRVTLSNDGQSEESSQLLVKNTDYTLTENDYDFVIDFDHASNTTGSNGEVTSAFKIVYDSNLEDEFVTDANAGTITNTVTRADTNESKNPTLSLTPNIFKKSGGTTATIDYINKTITWTLDIDAEKDLKNFVIEDDFTTTNKVGDTLKHTLTTWDGTGKFYHVTSTGLGTTPTPTITSKDGSAPAAGNKDFKVEFTNDIPKGQQVKIQYKTKYEIKPNGGVATSYNNKADATWKGVQGSNNKALDKEAKYEPDSTSPTNNNGYKKVNVDNNAQEFSWRIGVNINKQDINNATLTDILGPGHYIPVPNGQTLKDQITISKLNLTTEEGVKGSKLDDDNWTVSETLTDSKVTGFVITFTGLDSSENNEAYLIEYKSKDSDDIYGQSTGNARQYTNEATLSTPHNGDYLYNETATISNLANKLITKEAVTKSNQDIIEWTVKVNESISKLGSITLTDTPSSNQKVLTHTFKKQEIKLNAGGTSQNVGSKVDIDSSEIKLKPDGSFELDLGNLDGKGYIITYSTFFMGDGNAGETVSNSASIGYAGATAAGTSDKGGDSKQFKYSSADISASPDIGTLQLQKFKVNPLTGVREKFENVKFELWNKNNTIKLDEGTTDANGTITFEKVRYGKYVLKETTPTGYIAVNPTKLAITMNAAIDIKPGVVGKAYVIDNIEDVNLTNACPNFTLTVNDIDGKAIANKKIKLVNSNGETEYTSNGSTNASGQVSDIKRPGTGGQEVQAGQYTVLDANTNEVLGTVIVKYGKGECQGKVQPTNSCSVFTVTVKDDQGNPRTNVPVTLKNASNTVIATETTNDNGQFTVPPTTPAGTYKLYEGTIYLGNVTVSYQNGNCQDEVTQAPTCEIFTLTVKDVDGKPRQGAIVDIKDKNNPNATVPQPTNPTGVDGKVTIQNIKPGEYEVYENGKPIGEFKVDKDCKGTAQPAPSCPVFTLTVKDEDGPLAKDTNVTITNTTTNDSFTAIVGENGEVTFPSETPSGEYEVKITDSGKVLDKFDVTYTGNCDASVEKPRTCTVFEITVINPDGVTPKANTDVIVKDEAGTETTYTTDIDGKINLPSTQSPGKVTVYEVNSDGSIGEKINDVKVTYTENCKGEVTKNACPNFTLTVNDKDLDPVGENVKVTIKDQTGQVVETGKTNADGKILFEDKNKLQQGQSYTVFNEAGVNLGKITVSYINNICGAVVQVPEKACPNFTLTVQDVYGNPRPNVDVTIKDGKGNTVATTKTDGKGVATVPYTVEPGVYYVYEGNTYINYITVTDTCLATVKPQTGGGGGWTPPPTEPPVNPGDPTPGKPDPEKPVNPEDPTPGKPDPEKPVNPEDPTPDKLDPEKPVNPEDPTPGNPDPDKPVNPEDPTPGKPDPEKPVNPEDPTPGNPGSENPTNSGNTTTSTPGNSNSGTSVQDIIDQGKKLPPYNATTAPSQDTLDKYKDFLNNYSQLSKEDQLAVGKSVDIDKIKAAAKQMEAQLAKGKLPQTNGADQTGMIAIGLLLVAASVFFLRRRNVETK